MEHAHLGLAIVAAPRVGRFGRSIDPLPKAARVLQGCPPSGVALGLPDAPRGRELMDEVGCRACHALEADEVAGYLGASKDIAPNLERIGEKTDARWIYHWIKNPRHFSPLARMPSLRLTDGEASNRFGDIRETHWGGFAYAWRWDGSQWHRKW